jgi:hypothetical protein
VEYSKEVNQAPKMKVLHDQVLLKMMGSTAHPVTEATREFWYWQHYFNPSGMNKFLGVLLYSTYSK